MRLNIFVAVMLFGIINTCLWSQEKDSDFQLITLQLENFANDMTMLHSYQLDIAGVDKKNKLVQVVVNEDERNLLLANGFVVFSPVYAKGTDYSYAYSYAYGDWTSVDEKYKTPEEVEELLIEYNKKYPKLTKLVLIGESLEGRPIWALKISDNAEAREIDEPTILFNAEHHAREVMTPEVALDIIDYLLTNYGFFKNRKVTNWVNSNEIWVVPMVNPDGNNRVWNEDRWWRKNTRNDYGVDLNRNYPYMWGACNGSSDSTTSQTYRGEFPASEPETQTMMALIEQIRPVFDISYHSYSELVLYPYGCDGERGSEVLAAVGQKMGELIEYEAGTTWELLYSVDGADIDWMYYNYQVLAYCVEVNSMWQGGFFPAYDAYRDETVLKNRKAWEYLLDRLNGSGVRGIVRSKDKNTLSNFVVVVEELIDGKYVEIQRYRGNPDGTYHIVLEKGKYRLTFQADGYQTLVKTVRVGKKRVNYSPKLAQTVD